MQREGVREWNASNFAIDTFTPARFIQAIAVTVFSEKDI